MVDEKDKQKVLKKNVYGLENDYERLSASKIEEVNKINDLTRECNLLRDIINKIENNKKDQIEELYKRTKEKEVNSNNKVMLQKSIKSQELEIRTLHDEEQRL